MKITTEQIDEMEAALVSAKLRVPDEKINRAPEVQEWLRSCEEVQNQLWREFFHLARLGLWAEEHEAAIASGLEAGDRFYYGNKMYYAARDARPTPHRPLSPDAAPSAPPEGAGT